ncbi:MAG: enolase C-terminal domain-like protein [Desulfatiglans sp.]|nr:enolase C-terminal domain-like protein [Desulfatiglans sp.]
MLIDRVNVYEVRLPFLGEFSHATRKRTESKNIVVQVIGDQGSIKGYGEGVPRIGVTGETQQSAVQSIEHFVNRDGFPWNLNRASDIWDMVDGVSQNKKHHAALCALETALLDCLGKKQGSSIIEYCPKDTLTNHVQYGAILTLNSNERIVESCDMIRNLGINTLKVKLGGDFEQNNFILDTVRNVFGDECRITVDLTTGWDHVFALRHLSLFERHKVAIVEQPFAPGDQNIGDFARLVQERGIVLMADESVCSLDDAEMNCRDGLFQMVNIRLSKCGGFRRSLRLVNYLRSRQIPFQIGCHMGESGILSAAGRILCLVCNDAEFCEGSYDALLLRENLTRKDVSFGYGGRAEPLVGNGLGVEVSSDTLQRLSQSITSIFPK